MTATPAQLRALHAAGRRRGLSHDDIRAACGVVSLRDLTRIDAARILTQWNADRPNDPTARRVRPATHHSRRRPGDPPLLKLATDAQRDGIHRRLAALGWPDVDFNHPKMRGFDFDDWRAPHRTTRQLSALITRLDQILQKRSPARVACSRGTPREHGVEAAR